MTVRLTIEIDATSLEDALEQLRVKGPLVEPTAVKLTTPPAAAAEETRAAPAADHTADQVADPAMIYKALLDEGRKPAASSSTGDGVKIEVGSEVKDADGNVAVIHGLTRGKAVIEYEDGMGKLVDSSSLASVPYEDAEPAPAADA